MNQPSPTFSFAGRPVGTGHPPLVVAELSGNHNGNLARALALLDAAKDAGADAVKLQTYTADTITLDCDGPAFRVDGGPWHGRRLYDLYTEAATPWAWHEALFARGREIGLPVFSTPFDASAIDLLEAFDPPAHKIASFELVDLPLIEYAAATGRPLILSTGMATPEEIDEAVAAAQAAGCRELALLHCVSAYPAAPADACLQTIAWLKARTGAVVGLSDHSLGTAVAVAAVALGACVIEKHVTLSRADGGADAGFSLEPPELAALVRECRGAWQATSGQPEVRTAAERSSRLLRRSLFVSADMAEGEVFSAANVQSVRPAAGLPPKYLGAVLGRRASRPLARGTPLSWDMLAPDDGRAAINPMLAEQRQSF